MPSRRSITGLLLLALLLPLPAADSLSGTWRHEGNGVISIATLNVNGTSIAGHVVEGDQTYQLEGTVRGTTASVSVHIQGQQYPASLMLAGDTMQVQINGQLLAYNRQRPAGGLGQALVQQPTTNVPAQVGVQAPHHHNTLTLNQHTVLDPGMRNMPSHSLLVPAGWTIDGKAWWPNQNFFKIIPSQDIKVTAPDGTEVHIAPNIGAVDYWPSQQAQQFGAQRPAEGSHDNGYPVVHFPGDINGWRQWILTKGLPQSFPGATNITVDEIVVVPELTAIINRYLDPIRQQQAMQNQQAQMMGDPTRSFTDGAVLAVSSRFQHEGKNWEQLIIFGTSHFGLDSQAGRQIWWNVEPNISYRAPAGTLEKQLPLMLTIANSVRKTPQWAQMLANHQRKMNQIAAKGAADRQALMSSTNSEISDIIHNGWREREAIRDGTQQKVINTIRGVEIYNDPGAGYQVELPNTYEHVYANGNGGYVLTNDALYNPNTDNAVNKLNWTQLSATNP